MNGGAEANIRLNGSAVEVPEWLINVIRGYFSNDWIHCRYYKEWAQERVAELEGHADDWSRKNILYYRCRLLQL